MIVELIEDYLRQQAKDRAEVTNNPFRASSSGRCIREGCFDLLGLKGEPLQPRRMMVLENGNMYHDYLSDLLKRAAGWKFVDGVDLKDNTFEIDGATMSYHVDGLFQHDGGIGIVEFKTAADFTFDRARKGEIDHVYLCQAWCYWKATDFNPVVFCFVRKETSAMVEVIFDRQAPEKIVTQRLTGDPIELAKQDPLLVTEIRTPFDPSVEEYVRERICWLKKFEDKESPLFKDPDIDYIVNTVPGADAVEDEVIKVQGVKNAAAYAFENNRMPQRIGTSAWYAITTGRKILGFPCSYCQHMKRCFPAAAMEMDGDRPKWVIP